MVGVVLAGGLLSGLSEDEGVVVLGLGLVLWLLLLLAVVVGVVGLLGHVGVGGTACTGRRSHHGVVWKKRSGSCSTTGGRAEILGSSDNRL